MGDGTHERLPEPVDLFERADLKRRLAELRALERQRQVVGERHEQLAVVARPWDVVKDEQTDRAAREW